VLDEVALLKVLDQQMSQEPESTEAEIFNRALALAHDEDVSAWAGAIESSCSISMKRSPAYILTSIASMAPKSITYLIKMVLLGCGTIPLEPQRSPQQT